MAVEKVQKNCSGNNLNVRRTRRILTAKVTRDSYRPVLLSVRGLENKGK